MLGLTVMSNRLAQESSPYLLQHANNPVDWYPWGDAAFARARLEDKPIFLSIGYSTCHWCHVMEHESFEQQAVADVLNAHFVSIKVDREERPDVDRVYMTFVQATTGSGGWPMSVWLTPELKPFYGGTYFPPTSRWGRPGFVDVLQELARVWREERGRVLGAAEELMERLRDATESDEAADGEQRGARSGPGRIILVGGSDLTDASGAPLRSAKREAADRRARTRWSKARTCSVTRSIRVMADSATRRNSLVLPNCISCCASSRGRATRS